MIASSLLSLFDSATTELRRARAASVALDAMPIGVSIGVHPEDAAKFDGTIFYMNKRGFELAGLSPDDEPGKWVEQFDIRKLDGTPFEMEELPLVRALSGETCSTRMLLRNAITGTDSRLFVRAAPAENEGIRLGVVIFGRLEE